MCGFAGFVSFVASPDRAGRARLLRAMGDAISHRGPDDARYVDDGRLALVFRRLSIVDVEGGAQPFASPDGRLVLAANGEIYNHSALRAQLRARHAFASASDCEVALHAWDEWGEAALDRLHGMFALAVWDRHARELVLARDRLGIKPLYWCEVPDGLLFASELKSLLAHPACPRQLDWRALDRPVLCQPLDATYVQGVQMLAPGALLRVHASGSVSSRTWWALGDHLDRAPLGRDPRPYVEAYGDILEQAVREHLQRDVGAALLLSGGLDSSMLAALVARLEPDMPCYTIVERGSLLGGDVEAAQALTARLNLPWHPVRFDHTRLVRELRFDLGRFEEAVWMMDSPRFELEWVFKGEVHRHMRAAHADLKVVLIGQGADEFAGGYSHRQDRPFSSWAHYLRDEVASSLSLAGAVESGGTSLLHYLAPGAPLQASSPFHRMMLLMARQLAHHNLWHEDRSSSWYSLEARVPFLDHRLVELLAGVPASLHEHLFWRKEIVRATWRRFGPDIPLRQEKMGFLDAADRGSSEQVLRDVVSSVYPQFRDRYSGRRDCRFDFARLDEAAVRIAGPGAARAQEVRELLDCMAAVVFESQCAKRAGPPRTAAPVLREVRAGEWDALRDRLTSPAHCAVQWSSRDVVQLREGVEVHVPLRGDANGCSFVAQDAFLGKLEGVPAWARNFLRHLGTPAAHGFTVQDWVEELEVPETAFTQLLDVLAYRGAIEPPSSRRSADTGAAELWA